MKRTLTAAAVAMAAVSAYANIDVHLDNPNQIVNRPVAGNVVLTYTGTIDVELGYDVTGAVVEFPGLTAGGPFLLATFDAGFVTYAAAASPNVDYSGAIFTVTVDSTDALGFYSKNPNSAGFSPNSELIIAATNVDTIEENEFFTVNVVPEPASIAVLGIGAAALLRRRRR